MRTLAVVDGDPIVHSTIREVLQDVRVEVVSFASAADVNLHDSFWDSVHVVLVDEVGNVGEADLIRSFVSSRPLTEVVLIAGIENLESALKAVKAGATDYIPKPFDDTRLVRYRLKNALERSRLRREQQDLLAKVLQSEQRYALAAQGANDGLWDWDIESGHFFASERWLEIVGRNQGDYRMDVEIWMGMIYDDDRQATRRALDAHLRGTTEQFRAEYRIDTGESTKWVLARGTAVRDESGKAVRMAGSLSDVTLRKEVEAQIAFDAMHDSLTGLPNRTLFADRLNHAMARARRYGQRFGVLSLDMDRFKTINDSLGHLAGDELLLEAARRMESCLRETDTVARLGGDEFVILIDELTEEMDATRVAERIQAKLARPFKLSGAEVYSTVSIGITLHNERYQTAEEILRDADIAMYRAKAAGKACYRVFDEAMHQRAIELLRLETDLRRAIERHEFRIHYQPVVDLMNGELLGCEALLRWHRRGESLVSPDSFIPLAEETGLIVPIGRWVLRESCERVREMCERRGSGLHLSVNISGRQFTEPGFVDEVDEILRDTGVRADSVTLEITESVIMADPEFARETLHRLKRLNVGLAIDDFGTGYSSLAYLHRFPVDTIKVDRSFVNLLEHGGYELEIVKTIVHLARTLGLNVVAEGVETQVQRTILTELGYRLGQGYLFARPMNDFDMVGYALRSAG